MIDLINRKAAIAMVKDIVEILENMSVSIEEKKVWAELLMNTILPVKCNPCKKCVEDTCDGCAYADDLG